MEFKSKRSTNTSILKNFNSKLRGLNLPSEIDYIILYTFLYKYCSDNLKDHITLVLRDEEMSLDESYKDEAFQAMINSDLMKLFGFNLKSPEAFIDEVINNNYSDRFFLSEFFNVFPKNIIFADKSNEFYFKYFFNAIKREVKLNDYAFENDVNLAIKDIIYSISKLDVFESDLPFEKVFDIISSSRFMRTESNPEYISQILSHLLSTQIKPVRSIYDPFMKDASSLFNFMEHFGFAVNEAYGKDSNILNCCYAIVKFFINGYSLNGLFLKQEDAIESADFNSASFDAIISKVPVSIKNYHSSNKTQSFEIAKRNKRSELEDVLLKNFGLDRDSFSKDAELNSTLESLVKKIDLTGDNSNQFGEGYESLHDSEFLFLINLIESLNEEGIMAISISQNFLFKNSLDTLRKYLVFEKNYIDAIISVPSEIERYRRPETVIVFRKNKINRDILFIDMSKSYDVEKRSGVFPGLFRRNLVLSKKTMDKMCDVFSKRQSIDKFSNLVTLDEIARNNFNLSVSRYVDTFEGEFVKLGDLSSEKEEIDSNISKLNLKIEKMMDELDIHF